jgi:hypothetical protein
LAAIAVACLVIFAPTAGAAGLETQHIQQPTCGACTNPYSGMTLTPSSGPAGAVIFMGMIFQPEDQPATPTTYILTYKTTNPASSGCSGTHPLPGIPSFQTATSQTQTVETTTRFRWPLSLTKGPY